MRLLLVARDDMGWSVEDAAAVAAAMPDATVGTVVGTGHVSPLLLDVDAIEKAVREFWRTATTDRASIKGP